MANLEQRLLQYDPDFTTADTHAAITSRRSELISAFRPEYEDGDVEGLLPRSFVAITLDYFQAKVVFI